LRAARDTAQVSAEGLARTVGSGAAQLLRLSSGGRLEAGAPADLIVLRPIASCPFEALVAAARTDIRLTVIDGSPLIGEPELAPAFRAAGVASLPARVDGFRRLVAAWIGRRTSRMHLQEPGFEVNLGRA
jgi:cytosine/adenosine deaminase-related metal-dependent hydrolase